MELSVKLDVSQFVERMDFAATEVLKGLRSAVDRSARSARRDALKEATADEGAGPAAARKNMPLVKASTQSSLSASWSIPSSFINIGKTSGATFARGQGLHASTFRNTGGGSAALDVPKAFTIRVKNADGSTLIMLRTKHGPGTHRGPGIRAISAELTKSGMAQADATPQIVWKKTATRELNTLAAIAI